MWAQKWWLKIADKLWLVSLLLICNMCPDPRLRAPQTGALAASSADECQVTPVIHVLQYPGCVPKPIPSFACIGRCASYLQVLA